MTTQEINSITNKSYWEDYYTNNYNKEHIISVCSKYDMYWKILIENNIKTPTNMIEIGGFPGRYLAYLASKYNLIPTCLDYNENIELSKFCFDEMDVKNYELINVDFLNYETKKQYDIVYSNGFIEHFQDYNKVLDKHVDYLISGGTMMITVPNKRNFRYLFGLFFDRNNLKQHNTKCMKKEVFLEFAERNNLELVSFSYFGGFPFTVHQKLNFIQNIFYKPIRILFKKINPFLEKHPNRFTCSLLICIVKKS